MPAKKKVKLPPLQFDESFRDDFFDGISQRGIDAGIRRLLEVRSMVLRFVASEEYVGGPVFITGDQERHEKRMRIRIEEQLSKNTGISYIQ